MANILYGIINWMDEISKLWESVKVDRKSVTSYKIAKIPESLNVFPSAITFILKVDTSYSLGGGARCIYHGQTEFHLTAGVTRSEMGFVMQFPDKVIAAAAKSLTLGGKVTSFKIENPDSIVLARLIWGNEQEHFGLVVPWTVEENQSGKFIVSV